MRWFGVVGALALAACSASPSGSCPPSGSLEVTLVNTSDATPICDASVTLAAAGNGPAQPLAPEGKGSACYYFITVTPGKYTLAVSLMGYAPLSQPLTVTTDGCSVESPTLALELLPVM
jgi:hypothetical protein